MDLDKSASRQDIKHKREARLPGLIVVRFGRFWVRGLPFPNARHLRHPF